MTTIILSVKDSTDADLRHARAPDGLAFIPIRTTGDLHDRDRSSIKPAACRYSPALLDTIKRGTMAADAQHSTR